MSSATRPRFLRHPALHATVLALMLSAGSAAHASLPVGRAAAPRPIAPVDHSIVSESGLRFAWTPSPGAQRHLLLVSRQPFEPSAWARVSDVAEGVRAIELKGPVASPAEAGLTFDADGPLYWAAASELPGGALRISDVRRTHVLRRFANRVEQSPLLAVSPVRSLTTSESRGPDRIRLRSGFEIDPALGEPAMPQALRSSAVPASGRRTYIAYYGAADPEQTRRSIMASGGMVVSYLPDHAFLVRVSGTSEFSLDAQGAWVGSWQPAYKLSPRLPADEAQVVVATVLAFPDADFASVRRAVEFAGASVVLESRNGINQLLRIRATAGQLQALAQDVDVAWIEPYVQPEMSNQNAQWVVQTSGSLNRRLWDLGLHGEGQVVMTTDSGMNMGHNQFRDPVLPITTFGEYPTHRKVIAYLKGSDTPGIAFGDHGVFHGSHTAGTAAGSDDVLAADVRDGMAKGAKLWFMDLSGAALGNGIAPPADLNDLYLPGYNGNAGGAARIASNSWGAPVLGDYDVEAMQVDQFMWNHPDFLLFFSNGNSGVAGSVGSPGSAKDCVSAGGTGNNTLLNTIYTSTSRGPTQDGRRKPTICSPGQSVSSSTSGVSSYQTLSGTSMASPSMAGAAALIRQYVTEGWYPTGSKVPGNEFTPSAALLKAMCVNSGNNMITGFQAPDNNIGWGRINADSVCYFAGDARRLLLVDQTAGLGHGQTIEYQINVVDATQPLKVSLVWTDYPGNPAVTAQLVNNLNLTVTNGVTTYRGNVFSGGLSTIGGVADNVNVEEGVRVASPATGVWTVRVDAVNVPAGPQAFGLVITGGIGTDAGTLALDRASYGSTGPVVLRVTDNNAAASVTVHVTSTTEVGGEDVVLAGSNGVYTGNLPLSPVSGSTGDGTLQVSNGDGLAASYLDASPVATLNAAASVDFVPPTITAVGSSNQGSGRMLVTWTTDVGASSRVYYGTTPALGNDTGEDATLVANHQLSLASVIIGQTYYYDVESRDVNGNPTRDDNGGLHYRFTVNPVADVLVVYDGPSGFERPQRYDDALNTLGWTYDVWEGSLSLNPQIGDALSGMRAYKAVWWQNGLDNYPPFSEQAQVAVTQYLDNGGRMAVTGHDIVWANADPTSPYYTAARQTWVLNTLHTSFAADPAGWTGVTGVVGDPITDIFSGGVPYEEHRAGASGDEVGTSAGTGTATVTWNSVDGTPAPAGFRWESGGPLGTPGTGVWAGTPSRLATMYFEWTSVDNVEPTSVVRNDIMQKTLLWLIGRQKPSVAVVAPNGGEVLAGASVDISWTEAAFGGTSIGARTVEYSLDGGQSWTTLTTSAGPSPYSWNLTGVPNTASAVVRVRVRDDGTPGLSGVDASDATFAISHFGGDAVGPVVVPGSIHVNPNPVTNSAPATSTASVTDAGRGGSTVAAAEWSFGDIAAPAGGGHPMAGTFGSTTVAVSAVLTTASFPPGTRQLWVRARDAEGNWGPAAALTLVVNGSPVAGVADAPVDFGLRGNVPNPVAGRTTITYSLPVRSPVDLRIFDVTGRQVKRLVGEAIEAGVHQALWDRRDDQGRLVQPGVYYYRLAVAGHRFERRLVTMN